MIEKEYSKNKGFSFEIEEKINYEFKKFIFYSEWAFSFYCYLTGALSMKINNEELFQKIKNPFHYSPEDLEYEEMLTEREICEQNFKKLKKYHKYIFSSIQKIDSYFYILFNNQDFCKRIISFKKNKFSENFNVVNIFYSESIVKTIKNIAKNFEENFSKNEKIYNLYMNKKNYSEIIKEVYGKEYVSGKNSFSKFVEKIYSDQANLEQALLLIRLITELGKNDYLLWLKNTHNIMKKS